MNPGSSIDPSVQAQSTTVTSSKLASHCLYLAHEQRAMKNLLPVSFLPPPICIPISSKLYMFQTLYWYSSLAAPSFWKWSPMQFGLNAWARLGSNPNVPQNFNTSSCCNLNAVTQSNDSQRPVILQTLVWIFLRPQGLPSLAWWIIHSIRTSSWAAVRIFCFSCAVLGDWQSPRYRWRKVVFVGMSRHRAYPFVFFSFFLFLLSP